MAGFIFMEENQSEIAILIDGNNFYKGLEKSSLRSSFDLSLFDYEKLVVFIASGRNIAVKKYYKGVVKKEEGNAKSQRMVSDQQRLFSKLENDGWGVRRGRMSKNADSGQCEGFYFFDQKIENRERLKTISEGILKEHQFCYRPIIIFPQNFSYQQSLQKILDSTRDDRKRLKRLANVYFALNRWRKKGVDVSMAIDLLDLAYSRKISKNNLDTIVIVSSDSDLKPAIKRIQSLGMTVEYVGFEHQYSIALLNTSNRRLLLTETQLKDFFPQILL